MKNQNDTKNFSNNANIPYGLEDKENNKTNRDLLKHHKLMLELHLKNVHNVTLKRRITFFKVYDHLVTEDNIQQLYFRSLDIFIKALLHNKLDEITNNH